MDEKVVSVTCLICFSEIEGTVIVEPMCAATFHKNHLAAWTLTNSNCPMCRLILPQDLRDELRPKTMEERQKLQGIRDDFSLFFEQAGKTDIELWKGRTKKLRFFIYTITLVIASVIWYGNNILYETYGSSNFEIIEQLFLISIDLFFLIVLTYTVLIISELKNRSKGWEKQVMVIILLVIITIFASVPPQES